ncbi:MAG: hypothetical protein ACOH5I_16625 [Oligoflexus sp.]
MKKFLNTTIDLVLELLESIGLVLCVILASPLGFFRRLDRKFRYVTYIRFLAPRGLFAPFLRARLDYRMGNLQQSANTLSHICGVVEGYLKRQKHPSSSTVRLILCDIYSELMQTYLLSGQIEDAALIVIRAHHQLGIERLPNNPSFDVKTAHVVKAGIAAGKLLEEGGLATLMVKTGEEPVVSRNPRRENSWMSKNKDLKSADSEQQARPNEAKIIPFPTLT